VIYVLHTKYKKIELLLYIIIFSIGVSTKPTSSSKYLLQIINNMAEIINECNYYIQTNTSYLSAYPVEIDELLEQCVLDVDDKLLENPPITIFGKKAIQHRSIGFFSNESQGYYYSRQLARSVPLSSNLSNLLSFVNTKFNTDFNGILVNKYPDGTHYIGKHSDDEKSLSQIGVVSISFGATRTFRIRDKNTNRIIADIPTTSKEIWIMGGNFQKEFTHEIPIQKRIKETRISFTFRKHIY
jgi:alkylated DNA repair dioxygenase AlkB